MIPIMFIIIAEVQLIIIIMVGRTIHTIIVIKIIIITIIIIINIIITITIIITIVIIITIITIIIIINNISISICQWEPFVNLLAGGENQT